jgi:hypothetical protein
MSVKSPIRDTTINMYGLLMGAGLVIVVIILIVILIAVFHH